MKGQDVVSPKCIGAIHSRRLTITVHQLLLATRKKNISTFVTIFSLSMENEHADAGKDGRTLLPRPNFEERTGTRNVHFPCSADHWQPHPVDPYSATCDDHAYLP